ncbi:hypothetical protein GO988_09495 [Hymenobacter sp. HMF4947]|uniref:Uncharacterized protein n=1 Tax=Hymenobacter ginkgonis TaxID=2682976 RepID=A0A7K1TDS1_9BACT|nr:hypothetical protein [Hymenobacter ginkgonis]MVN76555.1 hypothetical protein [Hymenobacter ginkgonis]
MQSSITVQVSEAGAPSYNLLEAQVVNYNYQTGATNLTISGKLTSGKALTLRFTRSGTAAVYTTNLLSATLDGVAAAPATGTTTFSTQARTVDGTFQATFPVLGVLNGSFAGIALP